MDILLILIILCLLGGVGTGPWWGYHNYGFGPSGLMFFILIVLVVLYARRS